MSSTETEIQTEEFISYAVEGPSGPVDIDPYIGEEVDDEGLLAELGLDPSLFSEETDEDDEAEPAPGEAGPRALAPMGATSFFLAPALGTSTTAKGKGLFGEINTAFARRDHSSDGWIGDPSHAARKSDHNPDWDAPGRFEGIVRAIDVDINGADGERTPLARVVLKAAIGDKRVWYVIFDNIIYSRTYGWSARRYTGSNSHRKHIHVSLRHFSGEFDTSQWLERDVPVYKKTRSQKVDLSILRDVFFEFHKDRSQTFSPRRHVFRLQRALNDRMRKGQDRLTVDGRMGPNTFRAWKNFEREVGVSGRPGIPDPATLKALLAPRYEFKK